MIEVAGPDGVVVQFPDGTAPDVIKGVMAKKFGGPQAAAPQSTMGGIADAFTQGATLGFGDELTALESAVLGRKPGGGTFDLFNYDRPFSERYQAAADAERGQQDAFAEAAPVTAGAAALAGGLATGLGAGRAGLTLMRPGAGLGGAMGRAAIEGAAYGAVAGAGEADDGDRLTGAAYGAGMGGAVGGAAGAATRQVAKILAGRQAATQAPSTQQLKGMAGAAYDRARQVNPNFPDFDQWAMQAYRTLPDEGFHPNLHPQLKTVLDRVEELSQGGTAPDLKSLEQLRRLMQTPAGGFTNPDQQRLSKMLRDSLDTFMAQAAQKAGANPGNLPALPGQGVSTAQASALADVQEGRSLWARAKKGELIDRMGEMAEDRAGSTYSGGNAENAMRQNMRKILDNDKLRAKFSKAEIEAIRTVVRGEPIQNAMRGLGALSPLRGGLMSLMSGGMMGAGAYTANPLMMALPATAAVADALAKAGTRSQVQAVSSMVRGGPNAAATLTQQRISPAVQAVIRALSGQAGGATGALAQP